jgi:hypothetical protein
VGIAHHYKVYSITRTDTAGNARPTKNPTVQEVLIEYIRMLLKQGEINDNNKEKDNRN